MKSSNVLKLGMALVLVGIFIVVGTFKVGAAPKKFTWTATTVTHMKEYQNETFVKWAERVSECSL